MYTALDGSGEIVFADHITKNHQSFKCPGCNDSVFLKRGASRIAHFSHYARSACQTFSEGETLEHLDGKKLIYDALISRNESVSMEPFLPELLQRPDVLWKKKDGTSLAIEFQCSSLSSRRMIERTKGYKSSGYDVVWILGSRFFFKGKLTPFHKLVLKENESGNFILNQLRTQTSELIQISNFKRSNYKQLSYQIDTFSFARQSSLKKAKHNISGKKFTLLKQHKQLENYSYSQSKELQSFFKLMYSNRDSLISIPIELYQNVRLEWMIRTNTFEWKYLLLLWVESMTINQVITKRRIKKWSNKMILNRQIVFYEMPFVSKERYLEPFIQYLDVLTKTNVLIKTGNSKWTVKSTAKRFNSIEEKYLVFK